MKKILVTGGNGRFATILKKTDFSKKLIFRNKSQLNIKSISSIEKNIRRYKPSIIIHLAGISRPMSIHNKKIDESISINIIGTCNLVNCCFKHNIKIIYFSTNYVYAGLKGNYKESDPVLPWNNYAWSKMGGESAVQMYTNSLILRVSMTEKPFVHKSAYTNVKNNFIFQEDIAKLLPKLISKKGIINVGGKTSTIYNFAKKYNKSIKKKLSKGEFPFKLDMNLNKLKRTLKK
tara:strand:+ start:670 stop:1368 length:699 start_codon:yes stop_codon:yes gene_type:complete